MMEEHRILVHNSRIPVRWGDMDAFGHVNNTVYFRYAEQTRIEWLDKLGVNDIVNADSGPVIINASCTFLKPIVYPEILDVAMMIGKPGRSSLPTYFEIRSSGIDATLYAEGAAKIVWWNPRTGISQPLPEFIREIYPHY